MKYFILILSIYSFFTLKAQEAENSKVQAGLTFYTGLNNLRPETKFIDNNGLGNNLGVGMSLNYSFSKTIGFYTGLIFDFETFKYKKGDSNLYYYYSDSEIFNKNEVTDANGNLTISESTSTLFSINNRTVKPLYLSIPTMLLFRTKFIGFYRYFGKFGVINNFLLNYKYNDQGTNIKSFNPNDNSVNFVNSNMMVIKRDLSIYKGFVGICGGAEWNFTGSTCLIAELGYYYGFNNVSRNDGLTGDSEKNRTIVSSFDSNDNPDNFEQLPFKQNQILLKVSILF